MVVSRFGRGDGIAFWGLPDTAGPPNTAVCVAACSGFWPSTVAECLPRLPRSANTCRSPNRPLSGVHPVILVTVRENEPFEKALRRFRRKVEREGIRKDIKKNSFYLKPGESRRLKQRLAEKRRRKAARRAARRAARGRTGPRS